MKTDEKRCLQPVEKVSSLFFHRVVTEMRTSIRHIPET